MSNAIQSLQFHRQISYESSADNFATVMAKLKRVRTVDEGIRLQKIIESGKISSSDDENLIHRSLDLHSTLEKKDAEFIVKFSASLLGLHGYRSRDVADFVGQQFSSCFAYTAKFGWMHYKTKDHLLRLPLELHRDVLTTCAIVLEDPNAHEKIKKTIVKTLAYVINHPDMSKVEQLKALSLVQKYGKSHDLISGLRDCIVLEHATPELQQQASNLIFSIVQNERCSEEDRKSAIECLCFIYAFTEVTEKVRANSVKVLCDLIQNESIPLPLRKQAMEQLSLWLWTLDGEQFKRHSYALDILKEQLRTDNFDQFSSLTKHYLFYRIWLEDQKHPMVLDLLPLLKRMLSEKGIPLKFKLCLTEALPRRSRYHVPTEKALPLFRFMVEQIQNEDVPLELKKVYVKNIVSCFLYEDTRKWIAKEFPKLISVDAVLKLESIQENSELLKAAAEEKAACLKLDQELNSRFFQIPGSNLTMFLPNSKV